MATSALSGLCPLRTLGLTALFSEIFSLSPRENTSLLLPDQYPRGDRTASASCLEPPAQLSVNEQEARAFHFGSPCLDLPLSQWPTWCLSLKRLGAGSFGLPGKGVDLGKSHLGALLLQVFCPRRYKQLSSEKVEFLRSGIGGPPWDLICVFSEQGLAAGLWGGC